MQCLYCGSNLGLLSRGEFCSKKHQELWRAQQAELSIQRLKEAFSFQKPADKPIVAKARPTQVSVLDSPPKGVQPPPEFFAYDDPPARKVVDPPPPSPAPAAEEKGGVFYCGPADERAVPSDAPPDAGFVSIGDLNNDFRLPVFIRRPTIAKDQTEREALDFNSQFIQQSFARQMLEQRLGFAPAFSISLVEGCGTGLFGHSIPQLCLNVPPIGGVQVQLRSPEIPCRPVSGTAIQACRLQPEKPTADVQKLSSAHYEAGLIVLFQREAEPADRLASRGFQRLPGVEITAVQRPTTATDTEKASAARYEVGPMALVQREAEPANRLASSGFQQLFSGNIEPAPYSNTPNITRAAFEQNLANAKQAPLRELSFLCNVPVSVLQPCKHSEEQLPAKTCVASISPYPVGAMSLQNRGIENRAIPAQCPKNFLASLPRAAASQPAGSAHAPQIFALIMPRANAAPVQRSFHALAAAQFARSQARFGVPSAEVSRGVLAPQVYPRRSDVPACRASLPSAKAFAPQPEQPKAAIQCATKRVFTLEPAALLGRQIEERTSSFVPYSEVRPAGLPHSPATRPQPGARPLTPRRPAIAIQRTTATLPDCTFQTWAIRENTSPAARPASLPSTDSPRQRFRGKFIQAPLRKLDLQSGQFSALQVLVMPPETRQLPVCRPSEPAYEVRPLTLPCRNVERGPVAAGRQHEIIVASMPSRVRLRPQVASQTRALSVALARSTSPLPNSDFRALANARKPQRDSERSEPNTRLSTSLANGLGEAVCVNRRKLEFGVSRLVSVARAAEVMADAPETPAIHLATACLHYGPRPIALHQRCEGHQPKFVRYLDVIPVLPRQPSPPPPTAARVNANRAFGITSQRPATVLPNCTFHALATAPGASPAHWRTAATQLAFSRTLTIHVPGRHLGLAAPGCLLRDVDFCSETKRGSSAPEFAAKGVGPRFGSLSSRLPFWDSGCMPCLQLRIWPNWSDANLARAEHSSATCTLTWAGPGKPVLRMPLLPREVAAATRAAAGSTRGPAPRRDLRWVAQKVTWAPRP